MAVRGATRKGQPIAARVDGAHGLPAVHLPSEQSDRTQSDRTQSDRTQSDCTQSDCLKSAGPVSGANDRLERSLAPGLPTGLTLDVGNAGDHPSIRALFAQAGCDMPANEFSMRLDEPFYEPHDRLLARRGMKLAGHVRVQNRELYLLDSVVPVGWLVELAALPEFGGPRLAGQMIAAAEVKMRSEGAALALVRTDMPALFAQAGWTRWGRFTQTRAGTRETLAHISGRRSPQARCVEQVNPPVRPTQLSTRLWRHVEQTALERIYHANAIHCIGAPVRTSDYWRWLVSRHAYDAIYVAVSGRDRWSLDGKGIVGYAVVKHDRVLEMLAAPNRPDALEELAARVCGEFIEHDRYNLFLEGPADHPWHHELRAAGGRSETLDNDHGQLLMAKVLEPSRPLPGHPKHATLETLATRQLAAAPFWLPSLDHRLCD